MRIPHRKNTGHSDSTMTPLIDVVFLLLIFFVCTASFQVAEQVLPTSLLATGGTAPAIDVEPEPLPEKILLKILFAGDQPAWVVNGQLLPSLAEVRGVLTQYAEIDATLRVILDVDGATPLGHVIDVYDLCRIAGFDRIQFAASIQP